MSTINQNRTFRRRNAALMAAATAIVAGAFGQAAPANASPLTIDGYVAIAVSNLGPQVAGVGMGVGRGGRDEAEQAADKNCAKPAGAFARFA